MLYNYTAHGKVTRIQIRPEKKAQHFASSHLELAKNIPTEHRTMIAAFLSLDRVLTEFPCQKYSFRRRSGQFFFQLKYKVKKS